MDATSPSPDRLISVAVVMDRVGLSRTTLWRLAQTGGFPKPVRISANRVAWLESQVAAWINSRFASGEI